jgi:hypothetical protein
MNELYASIKERLVNPDINASRRCRERSPGRKRARGTHIR